MRSTTITILILTVLLSCCALPAQAQGIIAVPNLNIGNEAKNNTNLIVRPEISLRDNPNIPVAKEKKERIFLAYLNNRPLPIQSPQEGKQTKEEKEQLRKEWENFLGVDIFMPYFKAKEAEEWISEKASVRVYKLKGKPNFDDNQVKYIFKTKF